MTESPALRPVETGNTRSSLGHWGWAVVAMLMAAGFCLRQIDLYPPDPDSFHTLLVSGWLTDEPFTPADVVETIRKFTPEQMPLYAIALNQWGMLVGHDLAMARVFSIFAGLLAYAVIGRIAREYIAPLAGTFAIIVLASNAFFNMYLAYARMYTLLVMLSALVIWLYLRIMQADRSPCWYEVLAFSLAGAALLGTHAFGLLPCVALCLHHLLFADKDRRWLLAALAAGAGLALASPWLLYFFNTSAQLAVAAFAEGAASVDALTATWINVISNGSPWLFLPMVGGALLGWRSKLIAAKPALTLFACLVLVIGLTILVARSINVQHVRYFLAAYPIVALFFAATGAALFRFRRWLTLLAVGAWLATGLSYQESASWWWTIMLRSQVFGDPPTQTISRLALHSDIKPAIIGYPYDGFYPAYLKFVGKLGVGSLPVTQHEYYFAQHGIDMRLAGSRDEFRQLAQTDSVRKPLFWYFHQADKSDTEQVASALSELQRLGYRQCGSVHVGSATIIRQLRWDLLGCEAPVPLAEHQIGQLDYAFYAAGLDGSESRLRFIDQWRSRSDIDLSDLRMSHQLLNDDWVNVAQLDLPLVHESTLRRFSIDIKHVPAGSYRLMAVVYNAQTGERQAWQGNEGWVPEMQKLAEIVILAASEDAS